MTVQELTQTVLSLPLDMRLSIIDDLNMSLHQVDKTIEQEWINESIARMNSIETGKVEALDGTQVFQQIFSRYPS
jgi:hypothetical protein